MTQPDRPEAPEPALRTEPTTFAERAEKNLKYQLEEFPTWVEDMGSYVEDLASAAASGLDPSALMPEAPDGTHSILMRTGNGQGIVASDFTLSSNGWSSGDVMAFNGNALEAKTLTISDMADAADASDGDMLVRVGGVWTPQTYERPLGYGQSWQAFSSSDRSSGTIYQNDTGRCISVVISGTFNSQPLEVSSDGSSWISLGLSWSDALDLGESGYYNFELSHGGALIPPGHFYRIQGGFDSWAELR